MLDYMQTPAVCWAVSWSKKGKEVERWRERERVDLDREGGEGG